MEYKRLTDRDITKVCFDTWELCGLDDVCKRDCRKPEPCKIPQIIHRLAELEDKIEAGKLVFIDEPFWSEYHDCWAVFQRTEDIVQTCYMTVNQAKDYKAEKRLEEIRNETKSIDNGEN